VRRFAAVAGFLSWDKDSCHVDLEKELLALVAQAPEGEEARNGNHHWRVNRFSRLIVWRFRAL
jgi:hypothetical protein